MAKKEKNTRIVQFVTTPSLFRRFEIICEKEEKNMSVVLRELILKRIREEEVAT